MDENYIDPFKEVDSDVRELTHALKRAKFLSYCLIFFAGLVVGLSFVPILKYLGVGD